jgi:hypothetical protein
MINLPDIPQKTSCNAHCDSDRLWQLRHDALIPGKKFRGDWLATPSGDFALWFLKIGITAGAIWSGINLWNHAAPIFALFLIMGIFLIPIVWMGIEIGDRSPFWIHALWRKR